MNWEEVEVASTKKGSFLIRIVEFCWSFSLIFNPNREPELVNQTN